MGLEIQSAIPHKHSRNRHGVVLSVTALRKPEDTCERDHDEHQRLGFPGETTGTSQRQFRHRFRGHRFPAQRFRDKVFGVENQGGRI